MPKGWAGRGQGWDSSLLSLSHSWFQRRTGQLELLLAKGIPCCCQSPAQSCFFCCEVSLCLYKQPLYWDLINTHLTKRVIYPHLPGCLGSWALPSLPCWELDCCCPTPAASSALSAPLPACHDKQPPLRNF